MNLSYESIRERRSIRSFDGLPLSAADTLAIKKAFDECLPAPFGGSPRFLLVSSGLIGAKDDPKIREGRIGTYGLISKVPAFVVGAVARGPRGLEDFGYSMEGLVLRLTELGLGSCWIGGLFDRSAAAAALALGPGELMPAVLAIGKEAKRRTVPDRLTRMGARGDSRKPASQLFFDGDFDTPLASGARESELLEAVRLGPSASNKQPWRILRDRNGSTFHLHLEEDRLYNSALGEIHIQNIDMGIAMRHFEVAARAQEMLGSWRRFEGDPVGLQPNYSYIASWIPGS
ncbi:MAG: nitroreductase family protein [Rectinemataceae bacterium]